jgi:6-pyruvoyltetrahydropterin/6-carboxytetrahydropterin synthase
LAKITRICLIGPESTGKSQLAARLSEHFKAPWIPEYAREYAEARGNRLSYDHVEHIARGHMESEARGPRPEASLRGSFSVRVEARFEAAHYLREYRGISEPLHGHSYKVEAELAARGGGVDGDAIAVDFVSAKRKLETLAKRLDYGCINDVAPFTAINPSAENIARWFHGELSAAVADENAVVRAVTVWEGPVNSVTFRPAP